MKGAETNIDEYVPIITHTLIIYAKCWINVALYIKLNMNKIITTKKVERDVPIDLLIVCHILASKTLRYDIFFSSFAVFIFSLILSKITIVSLME